MILVTGGMGFLGLHVARALLEEGVEVILTRHRSVRRPDFLEAHWGRALGDVELDLRDHEAVGEVLRSGVDRVVHLAVPPRSGLSPADEMRSASEMFLPTITTAAEAGIDRVVLASSLAVYFGSSNAVWRETDPVDLSASHPITAIKRSEESLASFIDAASRTSMIRARITAVWGPLYQTLLNVPARLAMIAAGRGDEVAHLEDPRTAHPDDRLELMHVRDCGRAIARLVLADELDHTVYNVSSGLVRLGDLIDAANAVAPDRLDLVPPDRAPLLASQLDRDRLTELGFEPIVDASAGMADYVDWLRHNDR